MNFPHLVQSVLRTAIEGNQEWLRTSISESTTCRTAFIKTFYISSDKMDKAEAWHWVTVDAGFGQIQKYRSDKVPKISTPQAEHLGGSQVEWTIC